MRSTSEAASDARSESALRAESWRVGMWPLELRALSCEVLRKRADASVASVDLYLLTIRLFPSFRKDIQ